MRALVTGAAALVTQAFLWVTVAPSRSQTPEVTTEAEEPPQFVKNVMAELSAPLALVKHTAGHLSTTPPIQVLGPNAHRVAVVFITPARAAVAVAAAPQKPEIGGTAIVLPPLSGQTAFLDVRARKAWSAVADRNADADLVGLLTMGTVFYATHTTMPGRAALSLQAIPHAAAISFANIFPFVPVAHDIITANAVAGMSRTEKIVGVVQTLLGTPLLFLFGLALLRFATDFA